MPMSCQQVYGLTAYINSSLQATGVIIVVGSELIIVVGSELIYWSEWC